MRLRVWVVSVLLARVAGFSEGGGNGDDDDGTPFLQACDAIYLCEPLCPVGMTAVAPPVRSSAYHFGTADGTVSYYPGQLIPFELNVTSRTIPGKRDAGNTTAGNETAKYLGLLLYAVDEHERKVGSWEIPLESDGKFWLPPDPACEGRSLMHADAELKGYQERFVFRAPPLGTGTITFRVLVKQGETNKGAFYWPWTRETEAATTMRPAFGEPGGDLVVSEALAVDDSSMELDETAVIQWLQANPVAHGWEPQPCTTVCEAAGLRCDEAALRSAGSSATGLLEGVQNSYLCTPPLLSGCDAAPRMSGIGDGLCWYRDAEQCPALTTNMCDEVPYNDYDTGVKLCACTSTVSRRRRTQNENTVSSQGAEKPRFLPAMELEIAARREAAERAAVKVAQAGGCPSARMALQRRTDERSLLDSAAACPKAQALVVAARGGLLSSTADEAYVDYLVPTPAIVPASIIGPDDTQAPLSLSFLVAAAVAVAVATVAFANRHGLVRRIIRSGTMLGLLVGSQYPQQAEAHNWCATPNASALTSAPHMGAIFVTSALTSPSSTDRVRTSSPPCSQDARPEARQGYRTGEPVSQAYQPLPACARQPRPTIPNRVVVWAWRTNLHRPGSR